MSFSRLLQRLFLFLTSRPVLIVSVLCLFIGFFPMLHEQWRFLVAFWSAQPSTDAIDEMEGVIDGIGGILVAAGVFLEERSTLRAMAFHGKTNPEASSHTQEYLNEIAHQNGMGILLVGLFMEIGTLLLRFPNSLLDTNQREKYIFAVCLLLSLVSLFILFDFLKDYIKTYFLAEFTTTNSATTE
jgi:hypothetical protein